MEGKTRETLPLSPFLNTHNGQQSNLETNAELAPAKPPMEERQNCPAAEPHTSPSVAGANASRPVPNPGAAAGAKKRKTPAAARKPRKPQDHGTNQIHVYYGHAEDIYRVRGNDLDGCARVISELPQPRPMSLVDLQLWILKLFRLHPETQDIAIKGFLKECPPDFDPDDEPNFDPDWIWEYLDWETRDFFTDKCWTSFANKMKRRNVMRRFMLYVDCSEIKHYDALLKAVSDDYSQLSTVVLPGTKTLSGKQFARSPRLAEDLSMTAKEVVAHIARYHGTQMSPPEAWRAKQKALELKFGTFYDAHNYAPRLLKAISCENPGSFVDIKDTKVPGCKDFRVLHRIFWAFAQCIKAFQHCRPVLCLKGTPLCGKYQGVLLTALALDANNYPIPVAFAVVEGETKDSWLWFLRNLEQAVADDRSDICIIHDYKSELINAIEDLRMNSRPGPYSWRNVERRRDVQSRWCIQHLAENFFTYFGDKKLVMMFERLCQQKQLNKFVKIWKELDELTSKYTEEKEGHACGEMQQESVEDDETEIEAEIPCSQLDSLEDEQEGDQVDDSKRKITKFSDWIRPKPMEKWSLLHDKNGARYGIMGINIANVNRNDSVLKGIGCLPLSAIVEVTFRRMSEYFQNRSAVANKAISNPSMNFPEHIQDDMNSKMQKAQMHDVIRMGDVDKNVFLGKETRKFEVQSRRRTVIVHLISKSNRSMNEARECTIEKSATCSCGKPQLLHRLCSHIIAVCCHIGVSTATYMCPYYRLSNLGRTWSRKFDESNTLRKYRNTMSFESETPTWIPDKKLECCLPVFLTSDCGGTTMDEEEQECNPGSRSTADNQGTNRNSVEPSQA